MNYTEKVKKDLEKYFPACFLRAPHKLKGETADKFLQFVLEKYFTKKYKFGDVSKFCKEIGISREAFYVATRRVIKLLVELSAHRN